MPFTSPRLGEAERGKVQLRVTFSLPDGSRVPVDGFFDRDVAADRGASGPGRQGSAFLARCYCGQVGAPYTATVVVCSVRLMGAAWPVQPAHRLGGWSTHSSGHAELMHQCGHRAALAQVGEYTWSSSSSVPAMDGLSGRFHVVPEALPGWHGKLRVHTQDSTQFQHDDGTWFLHLGDTG